MKNEAKRMLAAVLGFSLIVGTCAGCGQQAEEVPAEETAEEPARIVTIEDGRKHITVENAEDKTIAQILEEAGVTIGENDILAVDPASDDLALRVLHRVTVTIVDAASNYPEEVTHTIGLVGGTVADALRAVGIEMDENWETDVDEDSQLRDKMEIKVTDPVKIREAEERAAAERAAAERAAAERARNSSSSGSSGRSSGGGGGGSNPKPAPTPPPAPAKTVVSTQVYEDCDGSGHGVKVITYSDGSQQEVAF